MAELHNQSLYEEFTRYTYAELERFLLYAKDEDEKDFYANLCQFYVTKRQKRIMEEKPF